MVTITEVAKRAGVSPTTASYALNGSSKVKAETKDKILKAAAELNYVPNRLAQSFRNGRTNTITMITNEAIEEENTFTGEFFGVLAKAREDHYDVLVKLVGTSGANIPELNAIFRNRLSDGYLLLGNLPEEYLKACASSSAKAVLLSAHTELPIVQVNSDGYRGIYEMTLKAIRKGRKRLGYFAFQNVTKEEKLRRQAFEDALTFSGMDSAKQGIFMNGERLADVRKNVEFCMANGYDCVICWNDELAYLVKDVLEARGIAVPDQIAVTGFDDITPIGRKGELTTVHQPLIEKGRLAMELLLRQINGEKIEQREHLIPCDLIEGESL